MKVDTRIGRVSYKIEDTDYGEAYTHQRICSGEYYPGVTSSIGSIVELMSFKEESL